jgi:hypothetical protein
VLQGTGDAHSHWKSGKRVAIVLDGYVPGGTFVHQLLDPCSQVAAADCVRGRHDRSS